MALVSRREGDWDEAVAYFEQALALDPRNVEFLITAGQTYTMLRRFPAALRLHDRALDILPNDPDMMASKGCNYLVQGNLQEAAGLLSGINEQTLSEDTVRIKITQLRLERNYGEAVRLLQARQAEFHFASPHDKGRNQALLALMQSFAGDACAAIPRSKSSARKSSRRAEVMQL